MIQVEVGEPYCLMEVFGGQRLFDFKSDVGGHLVAAKVPPLFTIKEVIKSMSPNFMNTPHVPAASCTYVPFL